jgi:predicted ArsR family transcriptional regulator
MSVPELLGDSPQVTILTALLSESDVDLSITHISDIADIHRTTVHDHIDGLIALNVVKETREVAGTPMYSINKQSEVAEDLAQLEWDLLDAIAEQ